MIPLSAKSISLDSPFKEPLFYPHYHPRTEVSVAIKNKTTVSQTLG
jgi:hypothetical protein